MILAVALLLVGCNREEQPEAPTPAEAERLNDAEEMLNALRNGQVGYAGCVVMEADRGEPASRCTACGWVFAHVHETCPFCQNPCHKTNLWQQIALLAAGHGIAVHFVGPDSGLQSRGGVAAFVMREDPWQSKPAVSPGGQVPAPALNRSGP